MSYVSSSHPFSELRTAIQNLILCLKLSTIVIGASESEPPSCGFNGDFCLLLCLCVVHCVTMHGPPRYELCLGTYESCQRRIHALNNRNCSEQRSETVNA